MALATPREHQADEQADRGGQPEGLPRIVADVAVRILLQLLQRRARPVEFVADALVNLAGHVGAADTGCIEQRLCLGDDVAQIIHPVAAMILVACIHVRQFSAIRGFRGALEAGRIMVHRGSIMDHGMPAGETPDLRAATLVKRFAGYTAVESLSFEVRRGSFFSILGPSGCGKTTLLRMIAGFIAPDSGDIEIGGRSMRGIAPNRRPVNMVFQQLALFPMMSVGENVAFGLARRGIGGAERRRRSEAMLERVGLGGAGAKRVDQLSGGQRQRVAIARSLVLEPTLLLLDEPLGALDLKLREHMKIELKQLQAAFGTTFVYITHDQSEALVLSDRVAVMNQGRFEQVGSPQDLYYRPGTPFVAGFVGANNRIAGRAECLDGGIVEVVTAGGWRIHAATSGQVEAGTAVEAFVRPEVAVLGRSRAELPGGQPVHDGAVESLLFDGANSAVLLTEATSRQEFRIALPQTGQFADLKPGERIAFSFRPERAVCFPAARRRSSPGHLRCPTRPAGRLG